MSFGPEVQFHTSRYPESPHTNLLQTYLLIGSTQSINVHTYKDAFRTQRTSGLGRKPSRADLNSSVVHIRKPYQVKACPSTPPPSPTAPQSRLAIATPYILLVYLQFFVQFILITLFLHVSRFLLTIRSDINHRLTTQKDELRHKISA
ncbi:hypothetical protein CROQUDRAFT_345199 [Cronartium quercuum f. sp. fusiforme G11]|uniref:Uncharacterized protein n=1 Tax=Cronartium quercuum f. sp. fusiforme G11 TaxID=708437 RepID=A0A9P6N6L0_9BASI|nr:hypothetical protein CROQUDRAFT_345199 [Cronartium quercuum f. sp. fusiforme G11]